MSQDSLFVGSAWPGWATVESEPAIFEQLLKDIGVSGVSVEEVYSLDFGSLQALKPIYGFIFLFHWNDRQYTQQSQTVHQTDVWFANQVVENACASLALLNIVLNIDTVDLGERLTAFKDFTKDFSPPLRGIAVTNFDDLRTLHNAFARGSEMAESDLTLMEHVKMKSQKRTREEPSDEGESFHFIAYIHKDRHLLELDGLNVGPTNLGQCHAEDWCDYAMPYVQERMQRYAAEEIRFNLLAVCKDPTMQLRARLSAIQADSNYGNDAIDRADFEAKVWHLEHELAERQARDDKRALYISKRLHDYEPFVKQMLTFLVHNDMVQQLIPDDEP